MEHKDVRVILDPAKYAEAPADVKKEGKLIDWSSSLYLNAMRMAAAGVLASERSFEKIASVLWWAGFEVPPGYFPSEHEANDYIGHCEEPLRMWVEADRENIERIIQSEGFRLAATGRLLDEAA